MSKITKYLKEMGLYTTVPKDDEPEYAGLEVCDCCGETTETTEAIGIDVDDATKTYELGGVCQHCICMCANGEDSVERT